MPNPELYQIGPHLLDAASALGLDPARLLRSAGLPADLLAAPDRGVTAGQFFALWQAAGDAAGSPEPALDMGRLLARQPLHPAIQGFAASPDIRTGFERLALFKRLVAPIRLVSTPDETGLTLRWFPLGDAALPPAFALFELVFFLELCRLLTDSPIRPLAVGAPGAGAAGAALRAFFGAPLHEAPIAEMRLAHADAARPMIHSNEDQYRQIEADLRRLLKAPVPALALRVRRALVDILPAGDASIDAVCRRLAISRRSLQRKLRDEGESFHSVLETTRSDLSLHYLARRDLSVPEIAYLLAYRDPNSFYRAFHGWTGMTPAQAQAQAQAGAEPAGATRRQGARA